MKLRFNLHTQKEADIFVRGGGGLNIVNMNKVPILHLLGMSAEEAKLEPSALVVPHWEINALSIMYVTRSEAGMQVAGPDGQTVCDTTMKEGDMMVIPQYFAVIMKASDKGCEWVSFKTSPLSIKSPMVGKASSFSGMPASVLKNAYEQLTYAEARQMKRNRQQFMMFLPGIGSCF